MADVDGVDVSLAARRRRPRAPTKDAAAGRITWRGTEVTPQALLELWRDADRAMRNRTKRIEKARAFRRKEPSSLVRVDRRWARLNPEAASLTQLTLPQRLTLERDLIARVGSSDPVFTREPLGFTERDVEGAEACAAYLNEWRLRSVPIKVFAGKGVEDGEFGRLTLPCDLDLDGSPDYFEYLSDRARDELPADEKEAYRRDDDDKRRRYVRRDADGARVVASRYRPRDVPDDLGTPEERNAEKDRRAAEARKQHAEDVRRYILTKDLEASATRVIPALDCRPIMKRGTGSSRYVLVGLIERVLYESWELLEAGYGWDHLGDAERTPRAARSDGGPVAASETGRGGLWYLYTLYVECEDDEGRCRPMIFSCVGGAATWAATAADEDDPGDVLVVDLYEEYGIEGPRAGLWSYHFGLHTEDDEPDHYGQPYLSALMDLLLALEAEQGVARAVAFLNGTTGYIHTPDPSLPDEAVLESDGQLRVPEIPAAGQIVPSTGRVEPFRAAVIGPDLWRQVGADKLMLDELTAIDTVPGGSGPSGHAMLVQQTIGTIAKRQNRECVLEATVGCGEAHLRILAAIEARFGIAWPIRTTQERPVGGEPRSAVSPAVFDPAWVRDGQFNLAAEFPEEANLAMVDLEASLADRGYSSFDNVQEAKGQTDPNTERRKWLKDLYFRNPIVQQAAVMKIARGIGNDEVVAAMKMLTGQGELGRAAFPGAPNGVPTAALNRGQGRPPGPGGPSMASSVRGGVQGAQMTGDAMQADAAAAMSGAPAPGMNGTGG